MQINSARREQSREMVSQESIPSITPDEEDGRIAVNCAEYMQYRDKRRQENERDYIDFEGDKKRWRLC